MYHTRCAFFLEQIRRAFAPVAVTFAGRQALGTAGARGAGEVGSEEKLQVVTVHAVSDLNSDDDQQVELAVKIQMLSWKSGSKPQGWVWGGIQNTYSFPSFLFVKPMTYLSFTFLCVVCVCVCITFCVLCSDMWERTVQVRGGSSIKLTEIELPTDDEELRQKYGCTAATCFLKVSAEVFRPSPPGDEYATPLAPMPLTVPPSYFFLRPIKTADLDLSVAISVANVVEVSSGVFDFDVSVNASSPFLFLEIGNSAEDIAAHKENPAQPGVYRGPASGWFNDNNFVAEAGVVYRMRYSQYQALGVAGARAAARARTNSGAAARSGSDSVESPKVMTLAQFHDLLHVRVLQHAYRC